MAFDAETGKPAWRRDIVRARTHKIYVGNDSATPSRSRTARASTSSSRTWASSPSTSTGRSAGGSRSGRSTASTASRRLPSSTGTRSRWYATSAAGRSRSGSTRARAVSVGGSSASTPAVYAPAGGKPQLVVTGARRNDGYDLATGASLWWIGKQGIYPAGSPVLLGNLVIAVAMSASRACRPRSRPTADVGSRSPRHAPIFMSPIEMRHGACGFA